MLADLATVTAAVLAVPQFASLSDAEPHIVRLFARYLIVLFGHSAPGVPGTLPTCF